MNIFRNKIKDMNTEEIYDNIYASSKRIIDMIDTIGDSKAYDKEEFKKIFRLIYSFMMASVSLLPGDIITSEQNKAFIKVGEIFLEKNYHYPLLSKHTIKQMFETKEAVAMINNAILNNNIEQHGVKKLWDIFKLSVSDFRMFAFDYLNVAYSLSRLKNIESVTFNTSLFDKMQKNMKQLYNIEFEIDDLEIYTFSINTNSNIYS